MVVRPPFQSKICVILMRRPARPILYEASTLRLSVPQMTEKRLRPAVGGAASPKPRPKRVLAPLSLLRIQLTLLLAHPRQARKNAAVGVAASPMRGVANRTGHLPPKTKPAVHGTLPRVPIKDP